MFIHSYYFARGGKSIRTGFVHTPFAQPDKAVYNILTPSPLVLRWLTTCQAYHHSSMTVENAQDIERIKTECNAMLKLLHNLEKEERELATQNTILAREALNCGFDTSILEPVSQKRRKVTNTKKAEVSSPSWFRQFHALLLVVVLSRWSRKEYG